MLAVKKYRAAIVLGIIIDDQLNFDQHITNIIERAGIRRGELANLGRTSWELGTGIMRSAARALLVSSVRFVCTLVGTGAYIEKLKELDVKIINVAARRVIGEGRSARRVILYTTSGLMSTPNIYILQCALILDRALRADGSEIRVMLNKWLCEKFNIPSVEPKMVEMALSLEPRRISQDFLGVL